MKHIALPVALLLGLAALQLVRALPTDGMLSLPFWPVCQASTLHVIWPLVCVQLNFRHLRTKYISLHSCIHVLGLGIAHPAIYSQNLPQHTERREAIRASRTRARLRAKLEVGTHTDGVTDEQPSELEPNIKQVGEVDAVLHEASSYNVHRRRRGGGNKVHIHMRSSTDKLSRVRASQGVQAPFGKVYAERHSAAGAPPASSIRRQW